jgi:phenylacetate-coenzyme A ligase PaaK-like adenylate-forming protein
MSDSEKWRTLRERHEEDGYVDLAEQLARLNWSRDEIVEARTRQLRSLLRSARAHSNFHRARLSSVDIDTLTEADLTALPIMTKDDLMDHFDDVVTDKRVSLQVVNQYVDEQPVEAYLFDAFKVAVSGGSSGRRGAFVYDWNEWVIVANSARRWAVRRALAATDPKDERVLATVTTGIAHHVSTSIMNTFPIAAKHHRIPLSLPLEEVVRKLNEVQPTDLNSYPSMIPLLAAEARAGHLQLRRLTAIQTVGERLTDAVQTMCKTSWGVEPTESWGCSEGVYASSCGEPGSMHLPDDLAIVEPVDEHNQPIPPGVRAAKILITSLFNTTLPLIRYEITDQMLILPAPCPCGSAYSRIAPVAGRLEDIFEYGDVRVNTFALLGALEREGNVIEYRVTQTPSGAHIDIHCCGPVDIPRLQDAVCKALAGTGVKSPVVSIAVVGPLERTAAGKLKSFVAL